MFIPISYVTIVAMSVVSNGAAPSYVARVALALAGLALFTLSTIAAVRIHSMFPKPKHDRPEDFDKLLTTGPYSLCRHPFYLSLMLNQLSIPLALASPLGLITWLASLAGWIYLIKLEERELIAYWGEEYLRYASEVPMLIPIPRKRKARR